MRTSLLWPAAILTAPIVTFPVAGQTPAVPGQCSAPAEENRGRPGCYLTGEIRIAGAPAMLSWHLFGFADEMRARSEALRHPNSLVSTSHGRIWLHVLSDRAIRVRGGRRLARVGGLRVRAGANLTVRFIESVFPPGMRTRVHAHPGPEAFYVLDGVQCMETPSGGRMVRAGQTYVVPARAHVQASPTGRRNIALVIHEDGQPWMSLDSSWTPSGFCGV